ncbi:I78 family peptidase inhibitor [Pseudomonas boanensis]|uniref:I78 family peptidase inhibitor n=1 Tax=Metapseudomonas boanensis TaxID=2822138 RepID=UPI0035D4EC69
MFSKQISLSFALIGLLLAGCSSTEKAAEPKAEAPASEASDSTAHVPGGTCDSTVLAALVGKQASVAMVEQAKRQSGAEMARVLRPHDPMTMDYNSRRLNIDVDDTGTIKQFTCG